MSSATAAAETAPTSPPPANTPVEQLPVSDTRRAINILVAAMKAKESEMKLAELAAAFEEYRKSEKGKEDTELLKLSDRQIDLGLKIGPNKDTLIYEESGFVRLFVENGTPGSAPMSPIEAYRAIGAEEASKVLKKIRTGVDKIVRGILRDAKLPS